MRAEGSLTKKRSIRDRFPDRVTFLTVLPAFEFSLKKSGNAWQMKCPFHADEKASFTVWENQPYAHCFGCWWHGDYIQFVREYLDFRNSRQAAEEICRRLGISSETIFPHTCKPSFYKSGKVRLFGFQNLDDADFDSTARVHHLDAEMIKPAASFLCTLAYNTKGQPRHLALAFVDPGFHVAVLRRMDGEYWEVAGKATNAPNSLLGWPIGIKVESQQHQIALIEGTGDFLAAYSLIGSLGLNDKIFPVAMANAGVTIWRPALKLFSGKRVRIFAHRDDPGIAAAKRWKTQLEPVAGFVDIFVIPPVECVNYTTGQLYPAKDLEDLCHIDYDAWEQNRFLDDILDFDSPIPEKATAEPRDAEIRADRNIDGKKGPAGTKEVRL
jgi:hypothetical protein